jgi:hypothetical protein
MKIIEAIVGSVFLIVLLVKVTMAIVGAAQLTSILVKNGLFFQFLALMAGLGAIVIVGWIAAYAAWHGFLTVAALSFKLIGLTFDWWAYTAVPKMGDWLTDAFEFIEAQVKS